MELGSLCDINYEIKYDYYYFFVTFLVWQVKKIYENEKRLQAGEHSLDLLALDFEKNYNMYIFPVHWQFGQLDQHPVDGYVINSLHRHWGYGVINLLKGGDFENNISWNPSWAFPLYKENVIPDVKKKMFTCLRILYQIKMIS